MNQMLDTWQALDLRRRVILLGAIGLTFVAVLSLAQIATRPGMSLLYSGLDPAAAGEVVGALEQMNVEAEVRGDAIYVSEDARDRVRLALAREGLPRQGQAGYELLDQISGFSATSDMFDAAYWRAKEGELARTILSSPGVRAARVHIAVPTRRPFARDGVAPTASVTITMAGGSLTKDQATAIRYMTALSVANLSPDQVAVIDSRAGMILAPGAESSLADAASQASSREAKLKAEIEQLLAARVGRDRARVSVTVETDRKAETVTERILDPATRVTIHSDSEEISDSSQGAAGNVTVASNLPDGDAAQNPTRESARTESRERQNFDYSETTRQTTRQAGAIRRISVAVLVDGLVVESADGTSSWQPRPDEELTALSDLVKAAIGFDDQRGDIVTVDSMAFQPDATPGALVEASPILRFAERNAMTLIQLVFLAIVAIVLGMTVIRPLLSQKSDEQDLPPGLTLAASGSGDATFAQAPDGTTIMIGPDGQPIPSLGSDLDEEEEPETSPGEALRMAVEERPEQTVSMIKAWLEETAKKDEVAA